MYTVVVYVWSDIMNLKLLRDVVLLVYIYFDSSKHVFLLVTSQCIEAISIKDI